MFAVCLLILAPVLATPVLAQERSAPEDSERRDRVLERLEPRLEEWSIPGASLAVFERGKLCWAAGLGHRGPEHDDPVDADTLFQAASISKPVAALGALRLVAAGELELDTDVDEFLLDWQLPEHDFDESPTLRRILAHAAGLTVHGFPGYDPRGAVARLGDVLRGEPPANTPAIRVDLLPGQRFRYSGGGYCVLQQMMIDVRDQDFPALMRELVLDPVGMSASSYRQPLPEAQRAQAARGRRASGGATPGGAHVYPEMAAAGLWTTPSDLSRFALALCRALHGEEDPILPPALAHEMLSRPTAASFGLGVALERGGAVFQHSGANDGFRCQLWCHWPQRRGIAVMTNADRGGALCQEAMAVVAEVHGWEPDGHPSLVEAERSFAARADAEGIDPAFLHVMADDGVLFRPGVVPAREHLRASPPTPGRLAWEPALAEVCASGDLGYTSGPYVYEAPGGDSVGRGHYFSVWRRAGGRWWLLADLGVPGPAAEPTALPSVRRRAPPADPAAPESGSEEARSAIARLVRELEPGEEAPSEDLLFGHPEQGVLEGGEALEAWAAAAALRVESTSVQVSDDGTLAVSWGRLWREGSRSAFLRVWRLESDGPEGATRPRLCAQFEARTG